VPRVLVIDNYDSFVYNLVQYLGELGAEPLGGAAPAFAERVRADYRLWGQVVRESGIKVE